MNVTLGFKAILPEIVKYAPAGASTRQFIHYAQEITSGRFCRYDYGVTENVRIYGGEIPPSYEIDRITCPVAVYYARNDALVAVQVKRGKFTKYTFVFSLC